MKTSYFAKPGIQENPDAISIALYAPKWWGKGRRFSLLAPTSEMLKQGYTKDEYFNLLDERIKNPAEIYDQLKDNILCMIVFSPGGTHEHNIRIHGGDIRLRSWLRFKKTLL